MIDKRYLYRGFTPDENGKTTITFNGENIKGYWVYGDRNAVPRDGRTYIRADFTNIKESQDGYFGSSDNMVKVIPETVGQWVTTDKNGKDIFDGDRAIKQTILFGTIRGVITYDDKSTRYVMRMKNADMCDLTDVEYYDNIFEQKESDNG